MDMTKCCPLLLVLRMAPPVRGVSFRIMAELDLIDMASEAFPVVVYDVVEVAFVRDYPEIHLSCRDFPKESKLVD